MTDLGAETGSSKSNCRAVQIAAALVTFSVGPARGIEVRARARIAGGAVHNPFYDFVDGAMSAVEVGEFARTRGDLRLGGQVGLCRRLGVEGGGRWTRYALDSAATAVDLDAALRCRLRLGGPGWLELGLEGDHYRVDRFPTDRSWAGRGRLRAGGSLGRRIAVMAGLAATARRFPERTGIGGDSSASQSDRQLQVHGGVQTGPWRPAGRHAVWAGANYFGYLLDSNAPALEGDLHEGHAWLDDAFGPFRVTVDGGIWWRRFDTQRGDRDVLRRDRGLWTAVRAGWTFAERFELAAIADATWSDSNSVAGRFERYSAGLELVAWLGWRSSPNAVGRAGPEAAPARRFCVRAPDASSAAVAGSFNEWSIDAHPLTGPDADGRWCAKVRLPVGRHTYAYVLDRERWVVPNDARLLVDDGFGQRVGVVWGSGGRNGYR